MLKHVVVASAALALAGCGGRALIESDMSRAVSASPSSPWLTVDNPGARVLTVAGLESKEKVQVTPDIASVVEGRLRTALQPKYFTDLIINCRGLEVLVGAKADAEPPSLDIDMAIDCRIVARGLIAAKSYRLHESRKLDPASPRLDVAVPTLIDAASADLAERLWTDVLGTGVKR